MGAYAYYKDEKYDDAVIATERFLRYHPGNKDAAYAYYLKGMCYYDQISAADRDQGDTQKAEDTFARLIALYPNSEYAEDVRNKVNLTEDYKAGQEMIIGRFYLKEGNYLSALNRFNVVLNEYKSTIQIEEALYRQLEIYAIFGMNRYADGYYQILQKNYPEGKWTAKATRSLSKAVCNKKPLREDAAAGIYSENRLCIHRIHRQTQSLCQFSSGDA
jgi:outer membrane protein assembly factor BamD